MEKLHTPSGFGQGEPLRLEEFQKEFVISVYGPTNERGKRRIRESVLSIARKNGKGLALDTPLPTPSGWTTMGAVQPGDLLLDERGGECRVKRVSPVRNLDCYEVLFSNGQRIVCDGDHLWKTTARIVRTGRGHNNSKVSYTDVRDTRELFATQTAGTRGDRNHSVALSEPMAGRKTPLMIDPYVLGAWLGDGTSANTVLTASVQDAPAMINAVQSRGYFCHSRGHSSAAITLQIYAPEPGEDVALQKNDGLGLKKRLRALGVLGDKHIPDCYLRASYEQRLALLQGLMDTDGHVSKSGGVLEYSSASSKLADGVCELLSTFGIKWSRRRKAMRCNGRDVPGENNRIQFMAFADELPVFAMPRKLARMRRREDCKISPRSKTVQIVSVTPVASVPTKCIEVDSPDHMFLCGETFMPTHNSAFAAALVLVHLVGPEAIPNGDVLSAATTKDQAAHIYKMAAQMVRLDSELDGDRGGLCKCLDATKRIVCYHNGNFYQSLAAEAKQNHGGNPVFCIYDELAQAHNRELYSVLRTAFGGREESLLLTISTQTNDPLHIMSDLCKKVREMEAGNLEDPYFFGRVYAVPEGADIYDEKTWALANPALGKFKSLDHIRSVALDAKRSPAMEAEFRNLELNQQVDGSHALLNSVDWRACEHRFIADDMRGLKCYGGLDLSSRQDLTAFTLSWVQPDGVCASTKSWFWTHSDLLVEREERDAAKYREWSQNGWIRILPGRAVDYKPVVNDIRKIIAGHQLEAIAFDRFRIDELKREMEYEGIPEEDFKLIEHGQGFKDMAFAVDALESRVLQHTLHHDGNPIVTYCLSAVKVIMDPAGNRKFDKSKATRRIDGAVTLAMSLSAIAKAEKPEPKKVSPYLTRGIRAL